MKIDSIGSGLEAGPVSVRSSVGRQRTLPFRAIGIDDALDGYVGLAISAGGGLVAALALLAVFYRPPASTP